MKEKFIYSSIILIIGGFLTKILGMIIKIIMTRLIGTEGIGLYMLILPTFSLFISLASFGFPVAVSKLVAEDTKNNKKIISSIIPASLIINIFLMIIILLFGKKLAFDLLNEKRCYYAIIAMALVIPFTSISSILRSYFFGKQKMLPHVISNVLEDITRLFLIIIGVKYFLKLGLQYAICYIVLINILSELTSIFILFFFLPKNFKLKKQDIKPSKVYLKDSLSISIPSTISRLVASIGYFLEPIILTFTLTKVGYSNTFIITEYGILTGYVIPLLLLPSFFTMAISQALLPIISKATSNNNNKYAYKKIKQSIFLSLLIGVPATLLFIIAPSFFLKLIYNTTEGIPYIIALAPICLLQYIQAPLSSSLDAMGKSSNNLKTTIIGTIIRTSLLYTLSLLKIGIWGLIISTSINIIFTTLYNFHQVKKAVFSN